MRIAVLGCGLQAKTIVSDLLRQADVEVVILADSTYFIAEKLAKEFPSSLDRLIIRSFDANRISEITGILRDADACISAVPYKFNRKIAVAAIAARTHMCDLGGNNDIVRAQLEMDDKAKKAGVTLLPDCGLAPGLVSIIAADAVNYFDQTMSVALRVGGIPAEPTNFNGGFNYFPTFSADGLINEYREPVTILQHGEIKTVKPLGDMQQVEVGGVFYEAFATSGGASTLPQTYQGQVEFLDYKTLRYPGHAKVIIGLAELGFLEPESYPCAILKEQINALEKRQDKVVLHCWSAGRKDGVIQIREVTHVEKGDSRFSAMAKMTGYPASVALLMLARGQLPPGAQPQEKVIDPSFFFSELGKRDIGLSITTERAKHP